MKSLTSQLNFEFLFIYLFIIYNLKLYKIHQKLPQWSFQNSSIEFVVYLIHQK